MINSTDIHERLGALRSCDWTVEMQALLNRYTVVLGWNADTDLSRPDFSWITISFELPASVATVEYSQMWQHAPDEDEANVLTMRDHTDGTTHLDGITLNLESRPAGWHSVRICAQCDAIDIVANEMPTVYLHDIEPEILKWWNSGFNVDR